MQSGSSWPTLAAGIGLAALVGIADAFAGYEVNFGLFYLAPIALVTWQVGLAAGVALSIACVVGMFTVDHFVTRDIPFPSHSLVPVWNALIRLGYFLVFARVFSALRRAHDRERGIAREDHLTGVANRLAFAEATRHEIARARRRGSPMTVAYLDCDDFKGVNDRHGHHAGDELLRVVAGRLKSRARGGDLVARLGGDEFGILLRETAAAKAREVIESLRTELLAEMKLRGWPVTFSIGVAVFLTLPKDVDEALRLSDRAMYGVKSNGKNSVAYLVVVGDGDAAVRTPA